MKIRVATVWLDGCAGCHMSFLDLDERLMALAGKIELVYSPLVDAKEFPDEVDVTIVEGAVATNEDLDKIQKIRAHSKVIISLGDCAVTGNTSAMRNPIGLAAVAQQSYGDSLPAENLPVLLETVLPVHQVVPVEVFVPGCPPSADTIHHALAELLAGRQPQLNELTRFGA